MAYLSLEVDVNTVSEDGEWSGLAIAAAENKLKLLNILLSHPGIEINKTVRKKVGELWYQLPPLMIACCSGNSDVVARLVQARDLNINLQVEGGWTAAHQASYSGHSDIVRILAQSGKIDWNIRSRFGVTPLFWALDEGHSDVVAIIVQQQHIDFNVKTMDGNGDTLAMAAIWGGDVKCVEILTQQERCVCWNVPDTFGDTPMMKALRYYETELVEILARCPRVDLNMENEDGDSPIMFAVKEGRTGCFEILARSPRVELTARDRQGQSLEDIIR